MPKRRVISIVSATATAGGLLATASASATVAPQFHIKQPRKVVVHYASRCTHFDIGWMVDGADVAYSTSYVIDPDGDRHRIGPNRLRPGVWNGYGTGCVNPSILKQLGKARLKLTAYNANNMAVGSRTVTWYYKRNTIIRKFNAAPEPARKGSKIRVSGRLVRLMSETRRPYYRSYRNKKVHVYFNPRGPAPNRYVTTVRTGSDGRFRARLTARRDGVWKVHFPRTKYHDQQWSHGDFVDVK